MFLYFDGEPVSGEISITLKKANQKLEHSGIRVDFIGQIGKPFYLFDSFYHKNVIFRSLL